MFLGFLLIKISSRTAEPEVTSTFPGPLQNPLLKRCSNRTYGKNPSPLPLKDAQHAIEKCKYELHGAKGLISCRKQVRGKPFRQ